MNARIVKIAEELKSSYLDTFLKSDDIVDLPVRWRVLRPCSLQKKTRQYNLEDKIKI